MSGFNNPVVGALALIRKAIRSPNYQAGTEGWTVNQDGSAEFNDVVVRGEVDVVGTDGSHVKVDSNAGQAEIELQPPDQTGATYTPAVIGTASAPDKSAQLLLTSPTETGSGTHTAQLQLEGSDGSNPDSAAYLVADKTIIIGDAEIQGSLDILALVTIGGVDITGAWTPYTPAWQASVTNPTIGNGTLTGAYMQIGTTVHFRAYLKVGSTSTIGSGLYWLTLPVTPKAGAAASFSGFITNGGSRWAASMAIMSDGSMRIFPGAAPTSGASNTVPVNPWVAGMEIVVSGTYEAA